MVLPDFLTEVPHGGIRVTGHRIGLEHLVDYYNQGFSAEMLLEQFPTLPLATIHKVIAFYLENRETIDAYVAQGAPGEDAMRDASPDLAALRGRYRQIKNRT